MFSAWISHQKQIEQQHVLCWKKLKNSSNHGQHIFVLLCSVLLFSPIVCTIINFGYHCLHVVNFQLICLSSTISKFSTYSCCIGNFFSISFFAGSKYQYFLASTPLFPTNRENTTTMGIQLGIMVKDLMQPSPYCKGKLNFFFATAEEKYEGNKYPVGVVFSFYISCFFTIVALPLHPSCFSISHVLLFSTVFFA